MNKDSMKEDSTNEEDLLEFLQHVLGCAYISDLKNEQYNKQAKLILEKIDRRYFSPNSIRDAIRYINFKWHKRQNGLQINIRTYEKTF